MQVIGAPLWSFNNLTVRPVEGLLIANKPSSPPLIITLPVKIVKIMGISFLVFLRMWPVMSSNARNSTTHAQFLSELK